MIVPTFESSSPPPPRAFQRGEEGCACTPDFPLKLRRRNYSLSFSSPITVLGDLPNVAGWALILTVSMILPVLKSRPYT